jgi:hypothetical protein
MEYYLVGRLAVVAPVCRGRGYRLSVLQGSPELGGENCDEEPARQQASISFKFILTGQCPR